MSVKSLSSSEDDAIVIGHDDVSNYNPEHILPQPPKEIEKIRKWLQPTDYAQEGGEFRKHLQSHMPGTGEWLTSSEAFQDWRDSDEHGLLWIKGIPGSGKSVVASHIIDSLAKTNPRSPVLYFFFRQIIDANHEPAALLRDWLDQVLQYSPPLQKELKEVVKDRKSLSSLAMEDLWNYLRIAFRSLDSNVFCIADALDEMDGKNDDFLQALAALGQWKPNKAKVLFTSRPVIAVEQPLRQVNMLKIRLEEEMVDKDIARYVDLGLQKLPYATTEEQDQVRKAVPGRANGIFLYAKLAMDAFLEPEAQIANVLQALSADLHELYTRLLREHEIRSGVPHDIQLLILQWVTHATRPLRLIEVAEVISVAYASDAGQRNLDLAAAKRLVRAAAGPLLEILPNETVCVIHHSFTEYLKCMTRPEDDGGYPILRLGETHARLALACLTYLKAGCLDSIEVFQDDEAAEADSDDDLFCSGAYQRHSGMSSDQELQRIRLQWPFFAYAASNWHIHVARSCAAGHPQDTTNAMLHNFLSGGQNQKAWIKHMWSKNGKECRDITPLHIAARYGLIEFARDLISRGAYVDAKDLKGKTPLWLAANSGHANVIRLLAQAGAEIDVDDKVNGQKPLHKAASKNHAEAVSALLEAGVDPMTKKTRENPGRFCGNAPTSTGHTSLMYACQNGHLEALQAFLPFLKDIDIVHRALAWSAGSGRAKLVQQILRHPGVDVNAKVRGDTPLYLACKSQDRDTIVALFDAGADPKVLSCNSGDEFGGIGSGESWYFNGSGNTGSNSALVALCSKDRYHSNSNDPEVLQELLTLFASRGTSLDEKGSGGSTLLHVAVNDPVLVKLLLAAGADANIANSRGRVPLHDADKLESVNLLIEEGGAKVDYVSLDDGRTPIMNRLSGYSTEIVKKLLEKNANVTIKDKKGDGALHILLGGHNATTDILRGLLAAGADPNELNQKGETPILLMRLDYSPSMENLDILVHAGADINAKDSLGMTLLSRMMRSNPRHDSEHKDAEALLEKGADRMCRDYRGRTLLHCAIADWQLPYSHSRQKTFVSRLDFLLSIGLDPQLQDHRGNNLVHEFALRSGAFDSYHASENIDLLKQLLGLGIDISAGNQYGRTLLHILASREAGRSDHNKCGALSVLEFVISKFPNINAPDKQGLTALHLASTVCTRTTKLLIDAGADPNSASFDGLTPLHLAARARQSSIVGLLLASSKTAAPAFVESRDMRDHSALYYACRSGVVETVSLLLDAGADATSKNLFEACGEFEAEQELWAATRHNADIEMNQNAGGLTVDDKSRPNSYLNTTQSHDLSPIYDVARLEEIIDLLFSHGCDTSGLIRSPSGIGPVATSVNHGHTYTFRCLMDAYHRAFPDKGQKQSRSDTESDDEDDFYPYYGSPENAKFEVRLLGPSKTVQVDAALHVANVGDSQYNSELLVRLLKHREYHVFRPLFDKGVDFLVGADENYRGCLMEKFIKHGYTRILKEIGQLEAERQLSKGKWHAFKDPQSPGLYVETSPEKVKARDSRECIFLLDALQRTTPNMGIVRLLVEDFHVDIEQSVGDQYSNHSFGGAGSTPLHYLAKGTHWWHVALAMPYLISKGASLDAKNSQGVTPLQIALGGPDQYVGTFSSLAVSTLLDAGADINACDNENRSCLSRSVWDLSTLQALMERGAHVDADTLHTAIESKNVDVVNLLLQSHADPNIRRKHMPDVPQRSRWMSRSDLPSHEVYPLAQAIGTHDKNDPKPTVQMMEALLAAGADPYAKFRKSAYYTSSSERDDEAMTELLRCHKPSQVEKHGLLLHEALAHSKFCYPILSMPNLDPNVRDSQGRTIVHVICHNYSLTDSINPGNAVAGKDCTSTTPTFLDCLIQLGADMCARDDDGRTIFHHMFHDDRRCDVDAQSVSDLPYLIKNYSSLLNEADRWGKTPLHMALRYGIYRHNFEAADILLNAGADPFAVDVFGNTCLHIVAIGIHESADARVMFKKLLDRGLDSNATNRRGETPIFNLNKNFYSGSYPKSKPEDTILAADALALFEDAGADLFAKDNSGKGLLHVAAKENREPQKGSERFYGFDDLDSGKEQEPGIARFQVLLQKGLNPMMEDGQKMTALDVAAACGKETVLKLFEKDGVEAKEVVIDGV